MLRELRRTVSGVRAREWWAALVVGAVVVAGACSGGSRSGGTAGPTVPEERSTTTSSSTSTTLDPAAYAVPETIDQAYVQRVVSAYDHVLGDAIRALKRDGGLSDDFLKHLLAIYTEPEFEFQQKAWREAIATGRVQRTSENPGDPQTTVGELSEATPVCIIARADRDNRANFTGTPIESPQDEYVVLVRKNPNRDPLALNPTPWVMAFDGFKNDNSVPRNSCGD
jgi:hypothetical protein